MRRRAVIVFVGATVAGAIGAAACSRSYAEAPPPAVDASALEAATDAAPSTDSAAPFCSGAPVPICDDFTNVITKAWTRNVSDPSSTIDVVTSDYVSPPSALRVKIVGDADASAPPAYAYLDQGVALPAGVRNFRVDAVIQTSTMDADPRGVRVLRIDSSGVPTILVITGASAMIETQSNMTLTPLGSSFPWTSQRWNRVSMRFTRVAGAGGSVQLFINDSLAAEGDLDAFDPPFTVEVGAYREASAFGAEILYDDVALRVE